MSCAGSRQRPVAGRHAVGAVSDDTSHTSETSDAVLSGQCRIGPTLSRPLRAGVRRLIKAGVLQVEDLAELITILDDVQVCDWVVYIQPPPQATSDPADVLKYLARYMTGGPISDRRLIEVKDGRVYFWARSHDKSGRQVPVSLSTLEFVRSWALHILPKGFTKARALRWLEQHSTSGLPAAVRSLTTRPAVDDDRPARFSSAKSRSTAGRGEEVPAVRDGDGLGIPHTSSVLA